MAHVPSELPSDDRLNFTFRLSDGTGKLALDGENFFGWLRIERLELEVPGLRPPIDLAAGPERFQHRRTRLRVASLRIDQRGLDRLVSRRTPQLARLGIDELWACPREGYLSVSWRVRDGAHVAEMTCRIYAVGSGSVLRLLVGGARAYGYLPTPAPLAAHRAVAGLLRADELGRVHEVGLGAFELDPLRALLWETLPPAGWRLPATGDALLVAARVDREAAKLSYGPAGSVEAAVSSRAAVELDEARERLHDADEQLRAGDLEGALRAYRAELAMRGPDDTHLVDRVLSVGSARPEFFIDAVELARQVLGRWPDYLAAHTALANIAIAQSEPAEAAQRFQALADGAAELADDETSARAALAAARLSRTSDPARATSLYERVLEHHPGHAEATEALVERYAEEARWHELVRLIRARAQMTTDPVRRARDHVRAAQILATELGEPNTARLELEHAAELAPRDPTAREALAEVHAQLRDRHRAIELLDRAASLHAERDEIRAEARCHGIAARLHAEIGDDEAAAERFERALALAPEDPSALEGAAEAAARRGDHRAAARLWSQLIEATHRPPAAVAHYQCELGRNLARLGDGEAARDALQQAATHGEPRVAADAHATLAEVQAGAGDVSAAAEQLGEAVRCLIGDRDRADADAREHAATLSLARATLLQQLERDDQAGTELTRAHELAEEPATRKEAALSLLRAARLAGDARAEATWLDALLQEPLTDSERAHHLVERARARGEGAESDLETALEILDDDEARADALALQAELASERGDTVGRARSLSERAALLEDHPEGIDAELDAARAWLDADEGALALEAARRAEAGDDGTRRPEVLRVLADAAWLRRSWGDVVAATRELLASPLEGTERARLLHRIGIACDKQGDSEGAEQALHEVLDTDGAPGDVRANAWRLLAGLHERRGDPIATARAFEALARDLAAEVGPGARADALYRAGELCLRLDDRDEQAEDDLEAALRLVSDHLPALDALEQLKRQQGDDERVAVILGRKIAATSRHPHRQKALLARLAQLQEQLGRPDVARESYARAHEIDPDYRPALRFLAADAAARGTLDEAADAFDRLAGELPGDVDLPEDAAGLLQQRCDAAIELARIAASRPHHAERARARLSELGEQAPDNISLRAHARTLAGDDDVPEPIEDEDSGPTIGITAEVRARALRERAEEAATRGDHRQQARALEQLAAALPDVEAADGSDALLRRVQLAEAHQELADLYYDHLRDPDRAREHMRRAAEAYGRGSRRDATLRILAAEAAAAEDWNDAAAAYEDIEPQRRAAADRLNLAKCYQRLDRPSNAIDVLEQARTEQYLTDEGAMLLFALHRELESKRELAQSLERGAWRRAGPEARSRLLQALHLYQSALGDAAAAARVRETLAEAEAEPEAETLAEAGPEAEPEVSDEDEERAAVLADAIVTRARELAAEHRNLDELLVAELEELRQLARAGTGSAALARALMATAAVEYEPDAAAALLREAGVIFRVHLGEIGAAADALTRALAITPRDGELVAEIETLLGELHDHSSLASALEQHLAALEGAERIAPLRALARVLREELGDTEWAAACEDEARALEAEAETEAESEAEAEAETETEAEAEAEAETEAEAEAEAEAETETEAEAGAIESEVAGELRIAAELERRGQIEAAVSHYEAAAAIAPEDLRPLHALERLYTFIGDADALSEVLGRLTVATDDRAERAHLWLRRAKLYRDVLHREAETYRCLKEAYANAPDDPDIAYGLRAVAMARGEWALAAELLYREIAAAADDVVERAALHLELALIYDEKLLDAEQARVNYEQALALDSSIPAAPRPLARIYQLEGRHADAAHMAEVAAERARTDDERNQMLHTAAACSERAGDREAARRLYHLAAVTTGDSNRAETALVRLSTDDAARGRTEMLELRLREADEEERKDILHQLIEEALESEDLGAASRWATSLLAVDSADTVAYRVLRRQAEERGDVSTLAALLDGRAAAVREPAERAACYYELGRLYESDLDDPTAAAGAYEQSLTTDPDHPGALEALARLAYERQDWPRARELYARLSPESCSLPAETLAFQRGEIAEVLGHDDEALACFREAAHHAPSQAVLTAQVRTALRLDDLESALSASRALLRRLPPDDVAAITTARLQLADLCQRAGESVSAIYYYELVLAEEPRSLPALRALTALYVERGDHAGAARTLRTRIALAQTPEQKAELLFQLGELFLSLVDDPDQAADAYLKAVDLAPDHVPTLRRLIEYYWRIGDDLGLLEIADDLDRQDELTSEDTGDLDLARVLLAAGARDRSGVGRTVADFLGHRAADALAAAVLDAADRDTRAADATADAARRASGWGPGPRAVAELVGGAATSDEGRAIAEALAE